MVFYAQSTNTAISGRRERRRDRDSDRQTDRQTKTERLSTIVIVISTFAPSSGYLSTLCFRSASACHVLCMAKETRRLLLLTKSKTTTAEKKRRINTKGGRLLNFTMKPTRVHSELINHFNTT